MIQTLFGEAGARQRDRQLSRVEGQGREAAADWSSLDAGDVRWVRSRRTTSRRPAARRTIESHVYADSDGAATQRVGARRRLDGTRGRIALNQPGGRIAFRFHGRDLHLVMGPPKRPSGAVSRLARRTPAGRIARSQRRRAGKRRRQRPAPAPADSAAEADRGSHVRDRVSRSRASRRSRLRSGDVHDAAATAGSVNVKVDPRPGVLSTRMLPPCASTIPRAIAGRVRHRSASSVLLPPKKRSNTCGSSSAAMPGPV